MYETLANLIKDHFGWAFLIGILCIGGFIYLIVWTCSIYYKIKKIDSLPCSAHSDKLELLTSISAKMESLPCPDHKLKIEKQIDRHGTLDSSIAGITASIIYMQKSIDSLSQSLQQNKGIIIDPFTRSHSPLSITEKGYEMIEELGLYEIFESNWMRIRFFIEENAKSKNPYDLQQFCIEQAVVFPEYFLREPELNKIKLDAYKTGGSLTSYMKVMAVMARDRYFEENNINVLDVDLYDPSIPEG